MDNHNHEETKVEPREWAPINIQLVTIGSSDGFRTGEIILETGN